MREKLTFKEFLLAIRNFFVFLIYPFLKTKDYSGHTIWWISYYDDIPQGWRKAFGQRLLRDLRKALIKDRCLYTARFAQIKSKYGELCLYMDGCGENAEQIISYYEALSIGYCEICGKPARYCTKGWITYLCENCFNKTPMSEVMKKNCRITEDYIPSITRFSKDADPVKVDLGIDYKKLWGLNENTTNDAE